MNEFEENLDRILNNKLTTDEKLLYYYEAWNNEENEDKKLKILKEIERILLGEKNGNK